MPTFYDSNGNPYELSIEIGRGGEGAVFYCPNDSSLVAKIYHEPIDDEKAEKLRWMAANRNDNLLKVSAWIVDTLHDRAGFTVGFVMPMAKAKEIHELYSLKSRRVHFPEANWQFLLHAATNVARAFYVLHKNDHIMGDVNHGNCVVLADGTVKLIDCDSYSIKTDKMRYRCDVGVATHLAPELQGIDLSKVEREKKHDNFGLAVIIFQLLFLGRHPFAGNYLGAEDKSLEDCIRERRFAYGNPVVTNVKQPPGTLSISQISPRLAKMFVSAFMTQNRPEAREWIEALEDLSKSLNQCSVHIGHHYFNGLIACPWCEIESKTGLLLFPFVSGKEFDNEFNIFTVEKLLASLEIPQNLPAKPLKLSILPKSSEEANVFHKNMQNRAIILACIQVLVVIFFSLAIFPFCGFGFGIVVITFFLVFRHSFLDYGKEKFQQELESAREGWNYLEREWQNYKTDQDVLLDVEIVRQKINVYHSIQEEKLAQAKQLEEAKLQHQLANYLSTFKLTDANLRGIEEEHLSAFKRFGIKTAADFNEARLNALVAIDAEKRNILLRWRRNLEMKFEFDSKAPIPEAIKNSFESQFTEKRRRIEKEIEKLLVTLRSASTGLRQQQQQMSVKAQSIAQTLAQAESNFAKVNNTAVMTLVLVMIPIFVPIITSTFQSSSYQNTNSYYSTPKPRLTPKFDVSTAPLPATDYENEANFKVNENITDKQLTEISAEDREKSARILHQQALRLIEAKDFKKAEKKLRLAVKFVDYYQNILYTLSNLLYDQKNYKESITFLEKSLKIDPENENAQLLIGTNYMKLKKYDEAQTVFRAVLDKNPESYEANFNLGIIYQKSDSQFAAISAFEKALRIKPDNVDARYEYGLSLYKSGDWERAKEQYQALLKKDGIKAAKLWKIMTTEKVSTIKVVSMGKVEKEVNLPANKATPPPSYARQ